MENTAQAFIPIFPALDTSFSPFFPSDRFLFFTHSSRQEKIFFSPRHSNIKLAFLFFPLEGAIVLAQFFIKGGLLRSFITRNHNAKTSAGKILKAEPVRRRFILLIR